MVFLLFFCSGRLRDIQVNLAPSSCSLRTLGVHLAHRRARDVVTGLGLRRPLQLPWTPRSSPILSFHRRGV